MWSWIVPDGLREITKAADPSPSQLRPQGGGTQDTRDEKLFTAIIYIPVSGVRLLGLQDLLAGLRLEWSLDQKQSPRDCRQI
jgi:hypothetical protein